MLNGNTIGQRLLNLRTAMKMTQEELGNELGLSGSTISTYERDERDLDDQARVILVNKYGVRLDWLLKGEGKPFDDRCHIEDVVGMYIRLGEENRKKVYDTLVKAMER